MTDTRALIGASELAEYLGVPLATVYRWNTRGEGPRFYRVGKHCRWKLADVEAWLELQAHGGGRAA